VPDRPIKFEFVADVAAYLRDVKKMNVTTEDLEDAFVGVSNSSEDLERKLSKAMKDAEKDTEALERAIKDLPAASDGAARGIDKDMDKVQDSMADAGTESAQEFKQNLGESLASGDISTILQDTAGGLVSGLSGPLSIAAAAVAGVAALAFAEIQKQAEELKAFTESLGGALRSLYEQGVKTRDSMKTMEAFNTFLDDQADKVQDLEDDWANTGVQSDKYLTALFRGGPELDAQRDALEGILDATNKQALTVEGLSAEDIKRAESAKELLKYLESIASEQGDVAGEAGNTATAMQEMARQMGLVDTNSDGVIDDLDKVADSVAAAEASSWKLKENLANLPKGTTFKIEYQATGATGGAFAAAGGQLRPVYAPKKGQSGDGSAS
jgi:hypothetical protein